MMTDSVAWYKFLPADLPVTAPALAALMQAPSLTAALKALPARFSVRLRHLGAVAWQVHEAGAIGLPAGAPVYGREVCLCLDEVPVVWARSVCAPQAAAWRTVLDCGERPLGERLFDGTLPLQRSGFDYAQARWTNCPVDEACWLRRSVFDWQQQPLLLVEVFLPSLVSFLPAAMPVQGENCV